MPFFNKPNDQEDKQETIYNDCMGNSRGTHYFTDNWLNREERCTRIAEKVSLGDYDHLTTIPQVTDGGEEPAEECPQKTHFSTEIEKDKASAPAVKIGPINLNFNFSLKPKF